MEHINSVVYLKRIHSYCNEIKYIGKDYSPFAAKGQIKSHLFFMVFTCCNAIVWCTSVTWYRPTISLSQFLR